MTNSSNYMGMLIDTTQCIGCRGCQVACKQWQELKAEKTTFFGGGRLPESTGPFRRYLYPDHFHRNRG